MTGVELRQASHCGRMGPRTGPRALPGPPGSGPSRLLPGSRRHLGREQQGARSPKEGQSEHLNDRAGEGGTDLLKWEEEERKRSKVPCSQPPRSCCRSGGSRSTPEPLVSCPLPRANLSRDRLGPRGCGDTDLQPPAVAEQTAQQQGLTFPEQRVPGARSPPEPRGVRGAGGGSVGVQGGGRLTLQPGAGPCGLGRVCRALRGLETAGGREKSRVLEGPVQAFGFRVLGLSGWRAAFRFPTLPGRAEREPNEAEAGGEGLLRAGRGRGGLGAPSKAAAGAPHLLWGQTALRPGGPGSFSTGGVPPRARSLRTVHGWEPLLPPRVPRAAGAGQPVGQCAARSEPNPTEPRGPPGRGQRWAGVAHTG